MQRQQGTMVGRLSSATMWQGGPPRACSRPASTSRRLALHVSASKPDFVPFMQPKIKICGITNAEDALVAVEAGADFVGMIMWPKAKRAVSDSTAKHIAEVAAQHGKLAVGVFVDEQPDVIIHRCQAAGIPVAQLHGDGARAGLSAITAAGLQVVYVMHATPDGRLVTEPPPGQDSVDWVLVDGLQGGSGQALDWEALQPPMGVAREGWLLAGGLKPENVRKAVRLARPTGVDVSSGVCGPDGLQKDARKIVAFVAGVKEAATPKLPRMAA